MFDLLGKRYDVILAALGGFLALVSFFKIEDITKLQISPYPTPIYPVFALGLALIAVSIVSFLFSEDAGWEWLHRTRIKKADKGYNVQLGQATLNIIYGRIEDYSAEEDSSLIALPANEFFDDACVNDKASSLGAYMHRKFPNRIPDIQQCIRGETKSIPSKDVEKERGYFQQSYGVGKCILLDNPLSSTHRIVLAAVTSKRAEMGLRSEISYIFQAVGEIHKIMADRGIRKVYSPLMGAGHGCLRKEVSLFSLVLAWSEILCKSSGPRLDVSIIVFKPDESAKPELNPKVIRRILRIATGMFK